MAAAKMMPRRALLTLLLLRRASVAFVHRDRAGTTIALRSHVSAYVAADVHDAVGIIETALFPSSQRTGRLNAGRDAQGLGGGGGAAVSPDDPRMTLTYAEFPLASFDELVDAALDVLPNRPDPIRFVDLGSGCARLTMYAALRRRWTSAGLEIGRELHEAAAAILDKGVEAGYFAASPAGGSVDLYLGSADEFEDVLRGANIVFAYSTAFSARDFDTELSAMVLGPEWSEMLAKTCSADVVVITTDRILDRKFGWKLVARKDVDNPEVLGSTGFVHTLQKS